MTERDHIRDRFYANDKRITDSLEGQYHKLLAIVMNKLGLSEIALSEADVTAIRAKFILVTEGKDGDGLLHIELKEEV